MKKRKITYTDKQLEKRSSIQLFLISCDYDYYCQGYEKTTGTFLSKGIDFEYACVILKNWIQYRAKIGINARNFVNLTVD